MPKVHPYAFTTGGVGGAVGWWIRGLVCLVGVKVCVDQDGNTLRAPKRRPTVSENGDLASSIPPFGVYGERSTLVGRLFCVAGMWGSVSTRINWCGIDGVDSYVDAHSLGTSKRYLSRSIRFCDVHGEKPAGSDGGDSMLPFCLKRSYLSNIKYGRNIHTYVVPDQRESYSRTKKHCTVGD